MIDIAISDVLGELADDLKSIDPDAMLREIATSVLPVIRVRVHQDGKASDNTDIGTYTTGYLAARSGNYKNKKGKKDAGYYTKGNQAIYSTKSKQPVRYKKPDGDSERTKYNRGSDTKVILSLTRQMEGDMQVLKTSEGYGIGYSNEFNYNKAMWNEKRYGKAIWSLSNEELDIVEETAGKYINKT